MTQMETVFVNLSHKEVFPMELKFDEKGLIPAIVQDHYSK